MDMKEKRNNNLQLLWLLVFGIAMGFFESSIVVYLRSIYYSDGFSFPIKFVDPRIASTELLRELASLVMIISVALIATKNFLQRFASFLFIFAVWDIFYYVFLKLLLNWPESFFTWDILFLIPLLWTGPVIAPIIASIVMILTALIIRHFNRRSHYSFYLELREWLGLLAGAFVIFVSFIWDYVTYLFNHIAGDAETVNTLFIDIQKLTRKYIPDVFHWWLYIPGIIVLLSTLYMIYRRNRHT